MQKTLALSLLAAIAAYVVGAFAGGWLVSVLSTNPHDRGVEAAMTGAFVFGPLAAVGAFVIVFVALRSRQRRSWLGATKACRASTVRPGPHNQLDALRSLSLTA